MSPIITEIIAKKRDGGELTAEEIRFLIAGVTTGALPDYQASAWLMAVYLRGMTEGETLELTLAMRDSGQIIDLSDTVDAACGPTLDKHSTGGVGDKTTLVVVAILAAAGVPMLKMSGRGLGFSGGTVDKLEAIPGLRTDLNMASAKAQVKRIGAALIGQTTKLAPADKILYALRDVTATIESIPLIASSIMSKKLASGGQRIVLDVKVGRGAFMKTRSQARTLAQELVRIGCGAGVPTSALLTAMDEPLGWMVGNALEVREAVQTLQNAAESEPRFRDLCLSLAAHSLVVVGKANTEQRGRDLAEEILASGQAADKFAQIIAAQGGPASCEAIIKSLPVAPLQFMVKSKSAGQVVALDAEAIGKLAVSMGAGRRIKSDAIDPAVGIELHMKTGMTVHCDQPLATLHLRLEDEKRLPEWTEIIQSAYTIQNTSEAYDSYASLVLELIV